MFSFKIADDQIWTRGHMVSGATALPLPNDCIAQLNIRLKVAHVQQMVMSWVRIPLVSRKDIKKRLHPGEAKTWERGLRPGKAKTFLFSLKISRNKKVCFLLWRTYLIDDSIGQNNLLFKPLCRLDLSASIIDVTQNG